MSVTEQVERICKAAHNAQYALAGASAERKNAMLRAVASAMRAQRGHAQCAGTRRRAHLWAVCGRKRYILL